VTRGGNNPPAQAGPLAGLQVLDFTAVMSGPYCTRLLADLGAEVVKVEPPEGDYLRSRPPMRGGRSTYFGHLNCGKRSFAIDLKHEAAATVLEALITRSDVLVENFRPGVMGRLGLGHRAALRLNPRLVYCSISGYGQEGPRSRYPAYAPIIHAASGHELAQMDCQRSSGNGDRPPNVGVFTADVLGGVYAFGAIQSALLERERTGRGQHIDVSLLESMLNLLVHEFQQAQSGTVARRPIYAPLRCLDGFVMTAPTSQKLFEAFCSIINRPELRDDPRFAMPQPRSEHWTELMRECERWTQTRTMEQCERALSGGGIPCTRYRSVADLVDDPQLAARNAITTVSDTFGEFQVLAAPFRMASPTHPRGIVPEIGEHTREILLELGVAPNAIESLFTRQVVA
jgi:crotonobetainyl-CoA:carnitine CoA-transferase CaiB-like acyl-CoA transferase